MLLLAGMLAVSLGVNLWQSHQIRHTQEVQDKALAGQRQQIIDAQNAAITTARRDILGGQSELGHQLTTLGLTPENIRSIAEQAATKAQSMITNQVAGGIKVVQDNNRILLQLQRQLAAPGTGSLPAGSQIIQGPTGPVLVIPLPGATPGAPGSTCLVKLDSPVLSTGVICKIGGS